MTADMQFRRRGLMLVLSSPSGAGKTTIARRILESDGDLSMSVSVTTRPKRPGEVEGSDYRFVGEEDFLLMVDRGELMEHANVFGHRYGTPRKPVEEDLDAGRDVLFDIDWQGAQRLKEIARGDLVLVFVLPPSVPELERRLKARAQDSDEVVAGRMSRASDEMSHYPEYDYIIVNRDVAVSVAQVQAILTAERLRRERRIGLGDFVKGLREG
jgi:guanylate kinase